MNTSSRHSALRKYHIFFIVLWIFALLLVGWSFFNEAQKNRDVRLVEKIESASEKISDYASSRNRLPQALAEAGVTDTQGLTYEIENATMYKLCATFATNLIGYGGYGDVIPEELYVDSHRKGYQCFSAKPTIMAPRQSQSRPPTVALPAACNTVGTANHYKRTGKILAIDTASRKITYTLAASSTTNTSTEFSFTYDQNTKFYDANCANLTVETFKPGDSIYSVVAGGGNLTQALAVQRLTSTGR